MADLAFELQCGRAENKLVCGVDEVGRGPLAGSVIACAALIPLSGLPAALTNQITDSKQLSTKQRDALYPDLMALCPHAIGEASVREIDRLNILQATFLAMQRAVAGLTQPPHHALIDGNRAPKLPCSTTTIIKGDAKSLSIAVASIIAKVTRDRMMTALAAQHPEYGWETNAGYGTAAHLAALETYGITPHHRTSFAPVAELSLRRA